MNKLVIFDLDGTILNTLKDLTNALNYGLASKNYPLRSEEEVRERIGNGVKKLVERCNVCDSDVLYVLDKFKEYYEKHLDDYTTIYPGIIELFDFFKQRGFFIAIFSNKYDLAVKSLCTKRFGCYTNDILGENINNPRKPDPTVINRLMKRYNTSKENTFYIGDSMVDYETSKNAGINSILVGWGYRNIKDLAQLKPFSVVKEPKEIEKIFEK